MATHLTHPFPWLVFAALYATSASAAVPDGAATTAPLTLQAAIAEGTQRSPDIQRARASKSESEWRNFEALGAGFLPKVSASAYHYFGEKYTVTDINFGGSLLSFPGFYPVNTAAVDVSIPIFDGLANIQNRKSSSLAEQASTAELSFAEFQLREDIRLAFYRSLAAQQLLAVSEQNVRTLDDHLKQVDIRKSGGVATNYDVLRVQVQQSEARADAIDAQDGYETSRKKLTQLMGLETDERPLQGDLPAPNAEKVRGLKFTDTPVERGDIQALGFRAEAAESARSAAASWLVPSLSINGEYSLYDSQVFSGSVQNTGNYLSAYSAGIFLKWNLFDGGVGYAREKQAGFRTVAAEKTTQAAKLQVPYDFDYWKRRYLSNSDHYNSKTFDIKRSEESVRLAKEEERAGTRTSTETLDAELDLFRAKAGVVNALINAIEAQIRLELVLGKEI